MSRTSMLASTCACDQASVRARGAVPAMSSTAEWFSRVGHFRKADGALPAMSSLRVERSRL